MRRHEVERSAPQRSGAPAALAALGIGAGLLWWRWAALQPDIDAETRDRLAPRRG